MHIGVPDSPSSGTGAVDRWHLGKRFLGLFSIYNANYRVSDISTGEIMRTITQSLNVLVEFSIRSKLRMTSDERVS